MLSLSLGLWNDRDLGSNPDSGSWLCDLGQQSYPFELLMAFGLWPLAQDSARTQMHVRPPYFELVWIWPWPKLVTRASRWHDWGGPDHRSAPRLQNMAMGLHARVSVPRSFWISLASSVFLFSCPSQSLSVSLFLPTSLVSFLFHSWELSLEI